VTRSLFLAIALTLTLAAAPHGAPLPPGGIGHVTVPRAPDGAGSAGVPRGLMTRPPASAFATRATPFSQRFAWPLGRQLHDGLLIVNYVDLDPTSGVLDYAGGMATYNGHAGTDNALYSFRMMDRGTEILAAANGTVAYIGGPSPYDRHCDFNWPDDGNWIWIDAGDGSYHEYYHLRASSMTVKLGDVVHTGELLGLIGSSGYSTVPHMHFEAGDYSGPGNTYVSRDPYHGVDNALSSLWISQPDYEGDDPFWILDMGVFTETQVGGDVANTSYCDMLGPIPQPLVYGIGENKLCMWFEYQSGCCDTATIVVRKPDNSVYGNFDYVIGAADRFDWFWAWFYLAPYNTPADEGTWTLQVTTKAGALLAQRSFTVGASTQYPSRFWPRAGRSFLLDGATVLHDTLRTYPLGPPVTYSLIGTPSGVTLQDSILSIAPTSTQPTRSSFFQVAMTDGGAHRDTAFYHVVDMTKPLDPLLAVPTTAPQRALSLAASPQPSRGAVALAFALPAGGAATLAVHDLSGRRVRTLLRATLAAGDHLERWDGRDEAGRAVPAGLYFARLVTPAGTVTRTIVRI